MQTSNITVESLRGLMKLAQRKDRLVSELAGIESEIAALIGGQTSMKAAGAPAKKAARKARTGTRGRVGGQIIAALQAAGPDGVKVTDLSKALGLKNANVHVWFATTGKKHADKIGRGHYRLKQTE
jgi:hypothetical protein